MGNRPLVLSAVVFFLLAGLTWWVLRYREAPPEAPYFSLKRQVPDSLEIAFGGDTTMVVPAGETGWQVVSPVEYPADGLVIESVLKRLVDLEPDRIFPLTPEKLDSYGIRHPRGRIRAVYGGGLTPDTLTIGTFTLDNAYDYTRPGSRDIVGLIDARTIRSFFLKRTMEIRDTRPMPFHESRAEEIRLLGPGDAVRVELRKTTEGPWRVERPYPGPASAKKVREYLRSVSHMHVDAFVREDEGALSPFGLDPARAGIRVRIQSGKELGFFLGMGVPGDEKVYGIIEGRPQVVAVSSKYVPVLDAPDDIFRLPVPVVFGLDAVDSLIIETPALRRVYAVGRSGPDREFRDVLGNWILMESARFEEATPGALRRHGLDAPRRRLVWMGTADTLAVFDIGERQGDLRPLRVSSGTQARPREILLAPERVAGALWNYLETRVQTDGAE